MQFADDCRLSVEDPLFKIFDEWKKYGCRLNKLISCQYKTEEWVQELRIIDLCRGINLLL